MPRARSPGSPGLHRPGTASRFGEPSKLTVAGQEPSRVPPPEYAPETAMSLQGFASTAPGRLPRGCGSRVASGSPCQDTRQAVHRRGAASRYSIAACEHGPRGEWKSRRGRAAPRSNLCLGRATRNPNDSPPLRGRPAGPTTGYGVSAESTGQPLIGVCAPDATGREHFNEGASTAQEPESRGPCRVRWVASTAGRERNPPRAGANRWGDGGTDTSLPL